MDLFRVQDPFRVLGATGSCSFERAGGCNVHASGWRGSRARAWSSCRTLGAPCRIESKQGGHPPAREPPRRLPTAQESGAHAPDGSHLAQEGVGSDQSGALCHPPPFPAAATLEVTQGKILSQSPTDATSPR